MTDKSDEQVIKMIWDAINSGITLKEVYGIPQKKMDDLYGYGYLFFNQGRFNEAEKFFKFLCIYDFYNYSYIMGLAAVWQSKKKYRKASDLYAIAHVLSKSSLDPIFHTAQCYLAMGMLTKAQKYFELVVEFSDMKSLKDKALDYIKVINKTQL